MATTPVDVHSGLPEVTPSGPDAYSLQDRIEWSLYRSVARVARSLSLASAHAFAARLAEALFACGAPGRHIALANLRLAFPDASERTRGDIARASYIHFARNLVDLARSESWSAEGFLAHVGFAGGESVRSAFAQGRGVIALMPHLGAFELALRTAPLAGFPLSVVVRPLRNRKLEADLARDRSRTGTTLIPHHRAAPRMLHALRRATAVAVLNDQYVRRAHGIWAPLFGIRCSTSPGVAALALRTGAAVVPGHVLRDGADHHTLHFADEIPAPAPGPDAVACFTAAQNQALERMIRAHPEQWLWAHRRFRHSPDLPGDPYAR